MFSKQVYWSGLPFPPLPLIQWTGTWENSRRWWGAGKPGVLQSMGSQKVGCDLVPEQQQQFLGLRVQSCPLGPYFVHPCFLKPTTIKLCLFFQSLDFPMWCITFLFYKKLVLKLLTLKTTLGVYFTKPTRSYFPCLLIHPLQLPSQWVLFKVLTISIKLPSWHPFPPPPRNAWKGIQLWADVRSFSKAFCVK